MDRDRIVISTHYGSTLDVSTRETVVAFETDGPLDDSTGGWSVHVNGIARHVTDRFELDRLAALTLRRGPPDSPTRFVTVTTDQLTGQFAADSDLPLEQARTFDPGHRTPAGSS